MGVADVVSRRYQSKSNLMRHQRVPVIALWLKCIPSHLRVSVSNRYQRLPLYHLQRMDIYTHSENHQDSTVIQLLGVDRTLLPAFQNSDTYTFASMSYYTGYINLGYSPHRYCLEVKRHVRRAVWNKTHTPSLDLRFIRRVMTLIRIPQQTEGECQ